MAWSQMAWSQMTCDCGDGFHFGATLGSSRPGASGTRVGREMCELLWPLRSTIIAKI